MQAYVTAHIINNPPKRGATEKRPKTNLVHKIIFLTLDNPSLSEINGIIKKPHKNDSLRQLLFQTKIFSVT